MEVEVERCAAFDSLSENLAYSAPDGLLRIWETETSTLKQEYLPSAHLTSKCTCLKWRRKSESDAAKKRRRSKLTKKTTDSQVADNDIIAVGSTNGVINLYNIAKGDIQGQLEGLHTCAVTDVCWSEDNSLLYSCSKDGQVVEWDITTAKHKSEWKAQKGGSSCLARCGPDHLLVAGRSISIWSLESQSQVLSCTGHATHILQMHAIFTESQSLDDLYVVSLAQDDRVISLWKPQGTGKRCKRAIASFLLSDEPQQSSLFYDQEHNTMFLAVLTSAGKIEVFTHHIKGSVKKPIKADHCISVSTGADRSLPVLAVNCKSVDSLVLMYGTPVCPVFQILTKDAMTDFAVSLVREDPATSIPVTRVTGVGNIRQPKVTPADVTTLTQSMEGNKRTVNKEKKTSEKRPHDEPQMSIEQRLALLEGTVEKQTVTGPVESHATVLAQALQSDDSVILNKTLQTSDMKIINTTIRRLPPTCIMPLMKHLTQKLETSGSSRALGGMLAHTAMIKWVRALLHIHASFLASFPELVDRLGRMYSLMENRVGQLQTFTRLQGRLELMLSQIARQKDDEGATASAALLTLQDESSDDDMMDDLDMLGAHSESEDGYLSADEDDLVKG